MKVNVTAASVTLSMAGKTRRGPVAALLFALTLMCAVPCVQAQDSHRAKVPGLDKISPSYSHQAFTGRVLSVDIRRSLLNVNAVRGNGTEIFPIKKSVRVERANGDRLKLEELQPGTDVIVYYDQRGEQRNVKDIVVLQSAGGKDKDSKAAPPS
jgi:hypothetical protein